MNEVNSLVRSRPSASSTAPNVTALIRNTHPTPTRATSAPATAGPTRRAALKDAEFSATALPRYLVGTSWLTNACRTGASKAAATPSPSANA